MGARPLPFRGHLYAFIGASSRFICELSTPEEAWFAHNSGPSGDIASPFFANLSRRAAEHSPSDHPRPASGDAARTRGARRGRSEHPAP